MAVELGLNRYVPNPSSGETEFQRLERRNRERTYLVLFVHDRSLSTQTGRHWMLPEDDLVRHSTTWHEEGGSTMRPEDIIVAAFVALRRIAVFTFLLSPTLCSFVTRRKRPMCSTLPRAQDPAFTMTLTMRSSSATAMPN